jgi:hypothetical protein
MERKSEINRRPDGNSLKTLRFVTALIGLIYSPLVFSQALKGNFNGDVRGIYTLFVAILIIYPCVKYLAEGQMRKAAFIIPLVVFLLGLIIN